MIWLEVRNNKQKPFLVCYIYRPHSATVEWTVKVEESIEKDYLETKEILLLGDLNFNNYRKRLRDTWWLLSMRLRTRLGHGNTYFCAQLIGDRWKSEPIKLSDAETGLSKHAYL